MKSTGQEIEFDPKALVERVKAFAKHAKAGKAMPRVRKPSGAALKLLCLVRQKPDILAAAG